MSEADSHPLDLRNARQAGVYRVMCADVAPLQAIAREEEVAVYEIDLTGADGKRELIERIHLALEFPADWGRNWDALADGLNDLSWLGDATPCLLVWRGIDDLHADAPELESTLIGILEDASANWAEDDIAFWSLICLARIPPAELDDDADAFRH